MDIGPGAEDQLLRYDKTGSSASMDMVLMVQVAHNTELAMCAYNAGRQHRLDDMRKRERAKRLVAAQESLYCVD